MKEYRALLGPVVVVVLFLIGTRWSPFEPHRPPAPTAPAPPPSPLLGSSASASEPPGADGAWRDEDWALFTAKVDWAVHNGVDTLPIGRAIAELGRSFVGTAYVPGTLEVEGPERVVINFRGLDCVTFVENVLAMTWFVRMGADDMIGGPDRRPAQRVYEALLGELRYRDGVTGYPTRLHYFSDWVSHNDERGLVHDLTAELGGVVDTEPVDFMSTHPDAYRQLADPAFLEAIRDRERYLSERGRVYVPEARIAEVADRIRDGDVIAATSTVGGLDVAHTGLALWVDGSLHLLHAPLVGEAVQVSEVPLADRIRRIGGQDGIIVARPVDRFSEGR